MMDQTTSVQSFNFPLLKNTDIVKCLSGAGITLTMEELIEPNRHKVDLSINLFSPFNFYFWGCC